jgi:hypothetical protein
MKPAPADAATPAEQGPSSPTLMKRLRTMAYRGLGAAVIVVGLLSCRSYPLPDFAKAAKPVSGIEASVPVPIFVSPSSDRDNEIVAFFVSQKGPKTVECTAVFRDEDYPLFGADEMYDFYRWTWGWKRVADLESFVYRYKHKLQVGKPQSPHSVRFSSTFSGDQRFFVYAVKHLQRTIPFDSFQRLGSRPRFYVNTWNHLYSFKNNNPATDMHVYNDFSIFHGSRREVEKIFKALHEQ